MQEKPHQQEFTTWNFTTKDTGTLQGLNHNYHISTKHDYYTELDLNTLPLVLISFWGIIIPILQKNKLKLTESILSCKEKNCEWLKMSKTVIFAI